MNEVYYKSKEFSEYFERRVGNRGEAYKRLVLDPIMFKRLGSLKGKVVMELGCGNGYLGQTFLNKGVRKLYLTDISKYHLEYARKKINSSKLVFIQQDATKPWKIDLTSIDIVYSNMMLNEVSNIGFVFRNVYKALRKNGVFIFSVTHPSWDLYIFAQELLGKRSDKVVGLGGYFDRKKATFLMNVDTKDTKYSNTYKINHYHRTISDYFDTLIKEKFEVTYLNEPEYTKALLKEKPTFKQYRHHPMGLIIAARKK